MDRQGDFAAILEELIGAAVPGRATAAASPAVDFLAAVEDALGDQPIVSPAEAVASYRDTALEDEFASLIEERRAAVIEEPPPLAPDEIAGELGLHACAPGDLPALRRAFALRNHPDRVPPHHREHALIRMQIANALIDDAVSRVSRRL